MANAYTPEQLEFIRKHIKNMSWKELTKHFNETYGINLSHKALMATGKRYGIKSGRTGRFSKGFKPWNRGKKGLNTGGKATQFKKGNIPHNYKPVGTETTDSDGYIKVKVTDPNKWKMKHILIWEEAYGPIPEGHVIIFGDGNKQNVTLENLVLVSRAQLARMNQLGLIKNNAELTKTGALIADICNKIGERKKEIKKK